ncbi:Zinc transporter ttm-1 [Parelaphostrongylus tenuis]|uniref:Zinc transporter ttm-1 n=1 Tax=Parelaphostrongylus tenuis TaxID=148309 RepID=A0AAD5RAH9_PARTN|nr:Zinc transporter ttm-1 [Parelaphostrongylus tenuis]
MTTSNSSENSSVDIESDRDDQSHYKKGRRAEKVLWAVTVMSAIFILAEFVGGYFASSLAIMTDAGHMLSDLLSFIISIMAIRTSRQPPSRRLSWGYERAEVLGAMVSVIILWVLTTILVLLAVERIINNRLFVDANVMLITASVGVGFNVIMGIVLHFGTGGHGHIHGGVSESHAQVGKNVNVRAAFIHVIGDLIQSIGVLIASLVIKFTGWELADPICTFIFSIIVLFTTITVLRDIFFVLMEATPRHLDFNAVRNDLAELEHVQSVHDLHLWSLNMDKTALSVHLAIDSSEHAWSTVTAARMLIRQKYGISKATVQVESYDRSMKSCEQCMN